MTIREEKRKVCNYQEDKTHTHNFIHALYHIVKKDAIFQNRKSQSALGRIFTAQRIKFSIKDFFSKCDQIRRGVGVQERLVVSSLNFGNLNNIFSELLWYS